MAPQLDQLLSNGPKYALTRRITGSVIKEVEFGIERGNYALRWKEYIESQRSQIRPDTVRPGATRPDATRPDVARPDTARPDAVRPDADHPDAVRTDADHPDAVRPDAVRPMPFVLMRCDGS